ncbi:hypothetical protein FEM48_Zijuj02G0200700 [Ziziphus jujuba var. spinosa]|uniref:Beta-glucosidase 12-like n=1 Tax=Ziziphus jujuba var. spinosa TaxID=714518 RepID=A0A978VXQ2_ZIZJJ|nr:hypothetical protein FEM48_Zijuj02G0200700 [Ziziphus jujuba var. spinosa]
MVKNKNKTRYWKFPELLGLKRNSLRISAISKKWEPAKVYGPLAYGPKSSAANASLLTDSHANLLCCFREFIRIYPRGIGDLLLYIKTKYHNPLLYITENGVDEFDDPKLPLKKALIDNHRIDYHYRHLYYLQRAIKDGVNVKGYFAWSLLDNFEWTSGYTVRFGINFVDYKNGLKRYPKLSAHWFKKLLIRN